MASHSQHGKNIMSRVKTSTNDTSEFIVVNVFVLKLMANAELKLKKHQDFEGAAQKIIVLPFVQMAYFLVLVFNM